ncbi:hypothetical protein Btru_060679 [Bulinus truncatus]|nr:hypothetical protein Btru_060679 [Bulinus truncatus]
MVNCVIYWMTTKSRNGTCRFCFLLAFIVISGLVVNSYWDKWKLEELLDSWSGFQDEKGDYSFTVVTGLFDIGRSSWWTQYRSYNEYLAYLFQLNIGFTAACTGTHGVLGHSLK